MPNRYIDSGAEADLRQVIAKYKENIGVDITISQAIRACYSVWNGDLKINVPREEFWDRVLEGLEFQEEISQYRAKKQATQDIKE